MASGLELEIAQCIVDATYALDIVFNCAVQVISTASQTPEIGVNGNGQDLLLLENIPALHLPEADPKLDLLAQRQALLDALIPLYEEHGLHWEDITADRIFTATELLQAPLLDALNKIPPEVYANFNPNHAKHALNLEAARATMELYAITEGNYSELQISQLMDFSDFEKLLTAFNAVSEKPAINIADEARQLISEASSQ